MKTWIISDTHTFHYKLNIPKVECVIHCGDFANKANPYENELEARNFLEWYKALPIETKILVCGNHDVNCFKTPMLRDEYPEFIWLENEQANIKGYNFYGSPYTPRYGDWAFTYKRHNAHKYWDCIPENTDILITHGSPRNIFDVADDIENRNKLVHAGCKTLYNKVLEIKPLLHCFGHFHHSKRHLNRGILYHNDTYFVNAACYNHLENKIYNGFLLEINNRKINIL